MLLELVKSVEKDSPMANEITILKVSKKGKKYLVETSDKEYPFDEDTLLEFGIFKDRVFSKADFEKILSKRDANNAFNNALTYLGIGMKSTAEVKKNLEKRDYHQDIIEETINRLEKLGYLNDLDYGRHILNYYKTRKGPHFITNKLYEKKVGRNIIEKVLTEYSEEAEAEDIKRLVGRDSSMLSEYPILKQRQLIADKLIRNGFSPHLVYEIVREYELIDESDNKLLVDLHKQQRLLAAKNLTPQQRKQKLIQALMNKGYEYQKISSLIE